MKRFYSISKKLGTSCVIVAFVAVFLLSAIFISDKGEEVSAAEPTWNLSINSIEEKDALHTTQYYTNYDGSIDTQQFDDVPQSGYCYAIVNIEATPVNISSTQSINISSVVLNIDGETYSAVTPVSNFLKNHNYTTFLGESLISSGKGYVAFEIPSSYIGNDGSGWTVSCDGAKSEAYEPLGNEVQYDWNYVDTQQNKEEEILATYNAQGKATIDNPFVVQNLYGVAPLTAVAIFETDDVTDVTVTVHGRNSEGGGTLTYPVSGDSTHHEVPIFGLYADYENKVTITVGNEETTVTIRTQSLPDNIETVSKVNSSGEQISEQLFVSQTPHQIVFDNDGNIRWYLSEEWSCKNLNSDSSYPMMLSSDKGSFWYVRNILNGSVYSKGDELINMTWMGKIKKVVSSENMQCDHDFTFVDESTVLMISAGVNNDTLIDRLDLNTGNIETYLKFSDLLDPSLAPSLYNAWGDLWHTNSIQYVKEDDSIVMSIRNQSIIMKMNYSTGEIEWALTPASGKNSDQSTWARQTILSDKVILPEDNDTNFEWFYNTHHANVISYDADNGIMELVVFDNGNNRYVYGEESNDDTYSRSVIYRIDEKAKTVKQEYSYGKERGYELYSYWYGSAQKLANGHVVGNFANYNGSKKTHIVESDDKGVVAEYQVNKTANGAYRTTVFDLSNAFCDFGLSKENGDEVHKYNTSYWLGTTIGETSNFNSLRIENLYRDNDTVSIYGSVNVKSGEGVSGVSLCLSGESGIYEYPIVVNKTSGKFYGLGVSLDSISDGSYSVYLKAKSTSGTEITQSLDKSITIGSSVDENITYTTNLPSDTQEQILESLTNQASRSSFIDMSVVQDPFGISPLTAMALFKTDDMCSVKVTAHGKTSDTDVSYDIEGARLLHEIPIVGLYYNDTTDVTIELTHSDGSIDKKELSLTTGEAPNKNKISNINVEYDEEYINDIAQGLTFCAPSGGTYFYAVDNRGDIRWYYAYSGNIGIDGVSFTDDDHLLMLDGSKASSAETNNYSAQEIDLLGRVYKSYFLPNMSFHHELKQLTNGNLIAAATDYSKETINDVIVEINSDTGEVVRKWDMQEIFKNYNVSWLATPSYELEEYEDEDGNKYNENWFHNNCVYYDENDDSFLISSRHQSAVIKMDASTNEVKWVLSDHNCLTGTGLESYLLNPVDSKGDPVSNDSFEWQYGQHAPMVCENGDIALFDNGNYRTKLAENRVYAQDNYSRIVRYHVDEENKTVSLVWQFGKELGSDHFCTLIGDVDELGENHYLGTFGGHCKTGPDGEVSDSSGAPYIESAIYEVKDDKVIWSLSSTPNLPVRSSAIYRAERVNITSMAYTYDVNNGQIWLGNAGSAKTADIDYNSYSYGLSNASITKVINEGNRLSISGIVENVASIKQLYVGEIVNEKVVTYPVTVKENGTFSLSMVIDNSKLNSSRKLQLYADMTGGIKLKRDINADTQGLQTFSSIISGNTQMYVGDVQNLKLTISPSGNEYSDIEWQSSNESVASIDSNGEVKANSPGYAIITGKSPDNGTKSQIVITVSGVSISPSELVLRQGETAKLSFSAVGIDSSDLTWSSSDKNKVSVDSDGMVTANEIGTETVTATYGKTTCSVDVKVVQRLDDGVYTIASKLDESMVLDISGASKDSSANLQLYKDNATNAQQFNIKYIGEGKYTISALCSDKPIDVAYASYSSGANVWQWESNGTEAQKWYLEDDNGDGYWTIKSALSGKVLDITNASKSNGTNVQVYNSNNTDAQQFKFIERFKDGVYKISSKLDKTKVLDISGGVTTSGGNLNLYQWNRSGAQMMYVRYASEGAYEIRPLCSGLSIDISGASYDSGANVQQYTSNGTVAQRFYLRSNEDGSYKIVSTYSGKCLDVANASTKNGTNIQMYTDNGTKAQSFFFESVAQSVTVVSAIDTRFALDVSNASTDSGANIQLYIRNGTIAQEFLLTDIMQDGRRYLLSISGFNAIDVANGSNKSGANVQQWTVNGTNAQKWWVKHYGSDIVGFCSSISMKWLDVSAGIAANGQNVQVYNYNGTMAQRFKLIYN